MDFLRQYIISVTIAALICGIAISLTKDAPGKELIRMISGLLLTVTVMGPVAGLDIAELLTFPVSYTGEGTAVAEEGEKLARSALSDIIKGRSEAYILDKAAERHIDIEVEVRLSDDQIPIPVQVVLAGNVSPYSKQCLSEMLEKDMGITKENQLWTG